MISVYYTRAVTENVSEEHLEQAIERFLPQLPAIKQQQISRIRVMQAKLNSLLGLLLLKSALHDQGETRFSLTSLRYSDEIKPQVPGTWEFNISHSQDAVCCALGCIDTQSPRHTGRIGIDIEYRRPLKLSHFKKMLSEAESAQVHNNPDYFYQLWTAKEAVLKAEGHSGVWQMPEIQLHQNNTADYCECRWQLYPLELLDNYASHVASEATVETINTHELDFATLLELPTPK